jgi:hypothetical protein
VYRAYKDLKEVQVQLEQVDLKEVQVPLEQQAHKVVLDHKAQLDLLVLPDLPVQLAQLDLKVIVVDLDMFLIIPPLWLILV